MLSPVLAFPPLPVTVGTLTLATVGLARAAEGAVWPTMADCVEICCAIADAGRTKPATLTAAAMSFDFMLLLSPWV